MSLVLDPAAQDLLFREAHTAYTFTDEPVTDVQIEAIYDLVKNAATAFNLQSLRLVLVRSDDARGRLVEHMGGGNKEKTAGAPLTIIMAADSDFHNDLPVNFPAFPGARDMFVDDDVARADVAVRNGFLQVAYFLVGIRAAGLVAGPMSGFDAAGIEKEFFPDGHHKALAVVNLGQPGDQAFFPRGPRYTYAKVVTTV